ncbi:hypothetical protein HG530_001360 [Fusarium avenaceum]|nr:hypothetical protein HG530_001360 [Fusarium avenaceum]
MVHAAGRTGREWQGTSSPKLELPSRRPMEAKQWIFEERCVLVGQPEGLLPLIPALHIRRKVGHSRGKVCGVVHRLGRRGCGRVEIVFPIDLRYLGGRVGAVGPVGSRLARVEVALAEEALDDAVDVDPVGAGRGHRAAAAAHFHWLQLLAACVVLAIPAVPEAIVAKLLRALGVLWWLLFTRSRGWLSFERVIGEVVYHDAVFAHEPVDNHGCFLHC